MAKISALTDGTPPQGTDVLPVARSGANRKLAAGSFPIVLARWGVPVGLASSGTMGNNGAASGMTALPTTYSGGIWLYIPAGAIAAGEPATAAFRWFKASSTTAGTFYNSSWDGAGIPPLGTDTPYATTGPGAFTGIATGEITAATVTVPAGAMGANGTLFVRANASSNTAAGNKFVRMDLGGTDVVTASLSSASFGVVQSEVRNQGVVDRQVSDFIYRNAATVVGPTTQVRTSLDSSGALSMTFTLEKATATNHVIWEGATVTLVYGA